MMRPLDVIFDARCFQTVHLRQRGIGRHALSLVRHAREVVGTRYDVRLLAVVDGSLPPLPEDIADLFDEIRPNAYVSALAPSSWFIALSPMTHDPLFVARLVDHPHILTAAIVYDFIPEAEPERYLPSAAAKLDYALSKYWLSRFDLFWPISRSSACELQTRLQVPDASVTVTGASINVGLGPLSRDERYTGPPQHILVVGGADVRKNVGSVIRAHARSGVVKERRIPLLVSGAYPGDQSDNMRALHRDAGGLPELLVLPGYVAADELLRLYQRAYCVVVPSRLEGFSLPVVEAMATGTPVVASRIPAHQELISSDELLFAADDDRKITTLVESIIDDAPLRASIVQRQESVWPRFVERNVSELAWQSIIAKAEAASRQPAAPFAHRGSRPKMAVMSPLPPDRSGVAHFTVPFLAELGKYVDLHVFTETRSAVPVPAAVSMRSTLTLPLVSASFDRVLGVMGNSKLHVGIFNALARYGGACVAHDARLLSFYYDYLDEARARDVAARELGRPLRPMEIESWLEDESKLGTLFLSEIIDACLPVFFHSKETARLAAARYGKPNVSLPFPIYREWSGDQLGGEARRTARDALGIPPGEVLIASFGSVHRTKSPVAIISAIGQLRTWKIPANLHFIGLVAGDGFAVALNDLCRENGLESCVRVIDRFVDEERYRNYLLAADVGIQFRTYGFGQISGTLQDCIAAGLPAVANDSLCEAMDAPNYVRRVPNDASPTVIATAIAEVLAADGRATGHHGERERYLEEHNFHVYTQRLLQTLGIEAGEGFSK